MRLYTELHVTEHIQNAHSIQMSREAHAVQMTPQKNMLYDSKTLILCDREQFDPQLCILS